MPLLAHYSAALAELLPSVHTPQYPARLVEVFKSLVEINDATIIVYPADDRPRIDYFQSQEDGSSALGQFIGGAFLLDPYYQAASKQQRFGFFRLSDLAPEGFRSSEYYRSFYNRSGYQDECGYLIETHNNSFVNISLARTRALGNFHKKHLKLLGDILPLIETLCVQHWSETPEHRQQQPNLRAQLNAALDAFGHSILTDREAQVIKLVLNGYSTRMAADKLSIAMETVKLHRKHAYAKLSISSQAELFYLFLDSLMAADDYASGDPLEAYLSVPNKTAASPARETAK